MLGLLTAEQCLKVFDTLLTGPALTTSTAEAAAGLLGRVVLSTPDEAFPALERRLTASGALSKLLAGKAPSLALLGQAFTQKALGAYPLTLGSLESLPAFHLNCCTTCYEERCASKRGVLRSPPRASSTARA